MSAFDYTVMKTAFLDVNEPSDYDFRMKMMDLRRVSRVRHQPKVPGAATEKVRNENTAFVSPDAAGDGLIPCDIMNIPAYCVGFSFAKNFTLSYLSHLVMPSSRVVMSLSHVVVSSFHVLMSTFLVVMSYFT